MLGHQPSHFVGVQKAKKGRHEVVRCYCDSLVASDVSTDQVVSGPSTPGISAKLLHHALHNVPRRNTDKLPAILRTIFFLISSTIK
jgi:hypothetical protein